jgi:DNA-binding transcriptional ArsR family regulator
MGGDEAEQLFDALGNARRRQIVKLLAEGAMGSGEVARCFECSWPATSKQLGILERAGLVRRWESELVGCGGVYLLNASGLTEAQRWLSKLREVVLSP